MKNYILSLSLVVSGLSSFNALSAQNKVTGLSDWCIFIDQGHSMKENGGLYGYSEAEKTLRVGLALRDYLQSQTDIKEIHMCRLTDADNVSLEGRTDMANATDADFYYSIHSDAGSPQSNSTLFMYGGWKDNGVVFEKDPKGGKDFADIICPDLTGVMRTNTRGVYADRCYYDGAETHDNKYPYLSVNRRAIMASMLSEAGFHTNPEQQQRNLNADYKRMEALSAFRSILEFMKVERPLMGAVCGMIKDKETGIPVNGATVRIGGKEYTTDSYETLFKNYSKDPNQLHNGYFFIEGFSGGANLDIQYSSPVHNPITNSITIASAPNGRTAENITWCDFELVSNVPAIITATEFSSNQNHQIKRKPIKLFFSRKMDRASVEQAISVLPAKPFTIEWIDDFGLMINTDNFDWNQSYTLTIDAQKAKNQLTAQLFDGNGDGTAGDNFVLNFKMAVEDNTPPLLSDQSINNDGQVNRLNPVIRFVFNEVLDPASVTSDAVILTDEQGNVIPATIHHKVIADESIVHLYPQPLSDDQNYIIKISDKLTDESGNAFVPQNISFLVKEQQLKSNRMLDAFETLANWWQPQQSGSSVAYITDQTSAKIVNDIHLNDTDNNGSCKLNYGWDLNASGAPYLRFYLPPAAAQNSTKINPDDIIEMAVYGDGSNTQIRFMIRDGKNQLEGSPWVTVNWKGWKHLTWNLKTEPSTGWVNGDGILDVVANKPFYLDGIHIRYQTGSAQNGALHFDNLRYIQHAAPVGIESVTSDFECELYPNPANDVVNIKSDAVIRNVSIFSTSGALIINNEPSSETVTINVSALSKGAYIVRIVTDSGSSTKKLIIK